MKLRNLVITFLLAFFCTSLWGQSLLPFKDDWTGKYGFKDQDGNVVVEPNLREVNPFYNGIAIVENERRQPQYVRSDGKIISFTQSIYELNNFSDDIGLVRPQSGDFFYISKEGETISPEYDRAYPFSEGVAIVIVDDKLTVINTSFEPLFELPVSPYGSVGAGDKYAHEFNSGLLAIQNADGKWGYIGIDGELSIPPKFTYPGEFVGNYALTKMTDRYSDEWLIINNSGDTIFTVEFPRFDHPEAHAIIFGDYFIWNPDREEIIIRNLVDKIEIQIDVPKYLSGYDDNIRPYLWDEKILYDGSIISLTGEIEGKIEYKGGSDDVIWNNEYLYSDDQKLYTITGEEFKP
ncbi:MAG: WG repeat-containing protein [Marinifilaceae bacterium]|nr:WG repeat-containing protein [Marinifilaceae bacterium]